MKTPADCLTQLFPHVRYVMNKYTRKLPKEDLKRLAKEISKKLVASDYKNNRVSDPTAISSDRARGAKKHVKEFLDKAVLKFKEHERRQAAERDARAAKEGAAKPAPAEDPLTQEAAEKADEEVVLTDVEDDASPASSASNGKRKREQDEDEEEARSAGQTPSETPSAKRVKEDGGDVKLPSPPPPPPPPPEAAADNTTTTPLTMTEDERSMKEQEEALVRENEEAQRLADEAERTKHLEDEAALERENEEAMRDFELTHNNHNNHHHQLPTSKTSDGGGGPHLNGDAMDLDGREDGAVEHAEVCKQEVLSH